jgi:hypothetical protein
MNMFPRRMTLPSLLIISDLSACHFHVGCEGAGCAKGDDVVGYIDRVVKLVMMFVITGMVMLVVAVRTVMDGSSECLPT